MIGSAAVNPLLPDAGPRKLAAGGLPVTYAERTTPNQAFEFTVPAAWANGRLTLVAEVDPPDGHSVPQCRGCAVDDVFTLRRVEFVATRSLYVRAAAVPVPGLELPAPESVFSALRSVLPVADAALRQPVGDYDAYDIAPPALGGWCDLGSANVISDVLSWQPRFPAGAGLGREVFVTPDPCTGGQTSPTPAYRTGPLYGRPTSVSPPLLSVVRADRPLTSVAHELIHSLGFPHSGNGCPSDPNGQPWPPDEFGELDGIGLDVNSASGTARIGGRTVGLYHRMVAPPGYPVPVDRLDYDLMSYCLAFVATPADLATPETVGDAQRFIAGQAPWEQQSWISPRLWDQLVQQLTGARLQSRARAARPARSERPLDRRTLRVTVLEPRRGAVVGCAGCAVRIRWRVAAPVPEPLHATVAYSADGARTWRTVGFGANRGSVRLPARLLGHSRSARVRVTVSGGSVVGSAVSAPFRSRGAAPSLAILSPPAHAGIAADALAVLSAVAADDRGRALDGRSVRWYAGHRLLGTGATLNAQLPAATRRLRVVARDALGRTTAETIPVTSLAEPPRFVVLPVAVTWHGRRLGLRIAASLPSVLTVSGRGVRRARMAVDRRPRMVVVRPRGRVRPRRLAVVLSAGGRTTRATVGVRR